MKRSTVSTPDYFGTRALFFIIFLLFTLISPLFWNQPVHAEGSVDITANGGGRAFLDDRNDTIGDLIRTVQIRVFARENETIQFGSSAIGIGNGRIEYISPDGTISGSFDDETVCGRIDTRAQETIGPDPGAGGYTPCEIVVGSGQEGIWQIHFVSPQPPAGANQGPLGSSATANWSAQTVLDSYIAAWDVTVRDTGGTIVPGRVYANYLPLNMGTYLRPLRAVFYIKTRDGALYAMDMNNIRPFAVIFFANNKGFRDENDNAVYRSIQFVDGGDYGNMPPGYSVHRPDGPDTLADCSHKIFFNPPDPSLPATAAIYNIASGTAETTWLNPTFNLPDPPDNFRFIGAEGTPGQAGTAPLGGFFEFENDGISTSYTIVVDANRNNVFNDDDDRVLIGPAQAGLNRIFWDGRDAAGMPVSAGPLAANAQITLNSGEVHFPIFDPETNPDGITITRLEPATGTLSERSTVYYDDRYSYTGANEYDYSLCAGNDTPANPPFPDGGDGRCYGNPPSPRSALLGVDSSSGAHAWDTSVTGDAEEGFGNRRGLDTWTYIKTTPVQLATGITIKEADLSIEKRVSTPPTAPGAAMQYEVVVSNPAGASDITGARVTDSVPASVVDVTWTCTIASPGDCGSGTGNTIDTTVDLDGGQTATIVIDGILDPDATSFSLTNTATVERPNDVTDPNPDNNTSTATAPAPPIADLRLAKTAASPNVNLGDAIVFTIRITNDGPDRATGVQVRDLLPAGLEYEASDPGQGTYNESTGTWNIGTLNDGASATLEITARTTTAGELSNSAQVSASGQFDPDSTPGNNDPDEDDQDSATVTVNAPALEMTKDDSLAADNDGNGAASAGDVLEYVVIISNTSTIAAQDVQFSDLLTDTLISLVPGSVGTSQGSVTTGNGVSDSTILINVGTVPAGEQVRITFRVTIADPLPPEATRVFNQGWANASNLPDEVPTDDPATVAPDDPTITPLVPFSDARIALTKQVAQPGEPFEVGDTIRYTIMITNLGSTTITRLPLTDSYDQEYLEYVSATPAQSQFVPGTVTWADLTQQFGDLPPGDSLMVTVSFTGIEATDQTVNLAVVENVRDDAGNTLGDEDSAQTSINSPTSVRLDSFSARAGAAGTLLRWTTSLEIDTWGFHLWRSSDGQRASAVRVTPELILARGQATSGAAYSWLDSTAPADPSAVYWLQEIELDGTSNEYGPARPFRGSTIAGERAFLPFVRR